MSADWTRRPEGGGRTAVKLIRGIALRCGQLSQDHHEIRVFAGGGIMPDSKPDVELAETHAKMRPILDALGLDDPKDTTFEGVEL